MAGEATNAPTERKKLPALSLLPPGSELKDVMLPRYDTQHHLTSVLKAQIMKLVSANQIEGTAIVIQFFKPDNTPRGQIDLAKAMVDQTKGILTSKEPVKIMIDGMNATGTGLTYQLDQGKGFLLGPATTTLKPRPTKP